MGQMIIKVPFITPFRKKLSEFNLNLPKRILIYVLLILMSFGAFPQSNTVNNNTANNSEIKNENNSETEEKNTETEEKDTDKIIQQNEKNNKSELLINLYGQWMNNDGSINMALSEKYFFEYCGDLNIATTNDGYDIYNFKVISDKKDDPNYIKYFGKGYYIVLELSDNEGYICQDQIYTENIGDDIIYTLDRYNANNDFSGQKKYSRYSSNRNTRAYIFTNEDENTAKKGTYSSRQIIEKSFIGEYKPMPDYKNNQNIEFETFTYTPERYTRDVAIGYADEEIVCEMVSSQYNDSNYYKLNGDGYYFMIKLKMVN